MSKNLGKFVWYDLMTTDLEGAQAFYQSVLGWQIKDSGTPGMTYLIASAGATMVGGMMPIHGKAEGSGMRPCWNGYIAVDNVDACADRVKSAGGSILRAPADIPNVGRFAVVADPHGAAFMLFHVAGEPPAKQSDCSATGQVGWHELHAGDGEADFKFYHDLFGWTKDTALNMGSAGVYQLFKTGDANAVGGMMTKMPSTPRAHWLYYFSVTGIDAAAERVKSAGGKILNGPMEVPGGGWIVQAMDPQGAIFALVGTKTPAGS